MNLTNDIAFGLRTPMKSAEKLKIAHSCALASQVQNNEVVEVSSVGDRDARTISKRVLAEICEPRVEEILSLVDQELVRSGFKEMVGAGVVLTGGSSQIAGIEELGEQIFDLPTRVGAPRGVGGLTDIVNNPSHSTAVGLLQWGAETHKEDLRFGIREKGIFNRILASMRKWFSEIS
jgi:cell division protein FtsA